MTLEIRLNGALYINFTTATVVRNLEAAASTFSFGSTVGIANAKANLSPIRAGDFVEIIADKKSKILTGYVDEEGPEYDDRTHSITATGRSKTQDLIDSTVGVIRQYENVGLVDIAKSVAGDFGIEVVNQAGDIRPFSDIASPQVGQKAFKFLESLARKRQVLLTDDGEGRLVITRASSELSPNSLKNVIGAFDNNIKSASRKTNIANLFHEYIAQGQGNPIDATEFETPKDLAEAAGFAIDAAIRNARRLEFYTEETSDSFTLQDRAKWELSIRRARNFAYKCTVQGHTFNNIAWKPNIRHQVDDDFAAISGQYLCKKATYNYSLDGSTTELEFVNKNSYTLQAEKDEIITNLTEF